MIPRCTFTKKAHRATIDHAGRIKRRRPLHLRAKAKLGKSINGRVSHTSAELAAVVLEEVGVAVVPGEAFGAPGAFRSLFEFRAHEQPREDGSVPDQPSRVDNSAQDNGDNGQ